MRSHLFATAALAALLPVSFVAAAEPGAVDPASLGPAETIVVVGLRPVPASDVTGAVAVLDRASLDVRASTVLVDQLRAVPGLAVSRNGALGALTQVRIRGAEANHTLVLIDGIEVSDPALGEVDFGLLSGLDTRRIEVVRGEQSVLYGSDAIGGVIAITTGAEGAPSLGGHLEAGSRETITGGLSGTTAGDRGEVAASVAGFSTDGVDTSGTGGERDGSSGLGFGLRAGLDLGGDWRATGNFRLNASEADFDADTDFDGRLNDVDQATESLSVNAGAALQGPAFGLDHVLRIALTDVERENLSNGAFDSRTVGKRVKLTYSPSRMFSSGGADVTLSGLLDVEREDYERAGTASLFGDPNQSQRFDSVGLAGEARIAAGPWAGNASVRQDFNDDAFDDATTWRLGGAYAYDFGGRVRASIGRGVKNPTFTELFGFFPGSFIGNPDLLPETSTSWELGFDQRLDAVELSATVFAAELEDEIFTAFNPDFTSTPRNRTGESERAGVELGGRWTLSNALTLSGQATRVSSENDAGAEEIRVPEWTAALALDWRSTTRPGLSAGLALDHVGEQQDIDFGTFTTVTLDAYTLVSANVAYPLTERLSVTLRGDNLLDAEATDVFGYANPGAGAYLGLRLR